MFKIRKAQIEDCKPIYEIRNDEAILKFFFDTNKPSYESHQAWFAASLKNDLRKIFVITQDETIAGVVRYDLNAAKTSAEVSIYIAKDFWGQGLGKKGLLETEVLLKLEAPTCAKIVAKVFAENTASLKMFEGCHYKEKVIEFEKNI